MSNFGVPQRKHAPQPKESDLNWRTHAACHGYTSEIFFPIKGDARSARHAKLICRTCTVISPCLMYALNHNEGHGVWGGKSALERADIIKRGTIV